MLWIDSSQIPWLILFFFFALTMLSDENAFRFWNTAALVKVTSLPPPNQNQDGVGLYWQKN